MYYETPCIDVIFGTIRWAQKYLIICSYYTRHFLRLGFFVSKTLTSSGTAGHHKRINEPVSGEALCTFRRQEVLSWETIARSYTCTRYEISFPLKKFLLPMGYVRYGSGVI